MRLLDAILGTRTAAVAYAVQPQLVEVGALQHRMGPIAPIVALPPKAQYIGYEATAPVYSRVPTDAIYVHGAPPSPIYVTAPETQQGQDVGGSC